MTTQPTGPPTAAPHDAGPSADARGAAEHLLYARIDRAGVIQAMSAASAELLDGISPPAIGEAFASRLDRVEAPSVMAAYARVHKRASARERVVMRFEDSKGRWRHLDLTLTNRLDDPDVEAIEMEGWDATAEWSQVVAGRLEERLLRGIPMPVCVTDDRGVLVWWNDRAAEALDLAPEEALGRTAQDIGLAAVEHDLRAEVIHAVTTVGHWEGEHTIRGGDGDPIPVRATIDRIEDPVIGFTGFVAAWLDISDRRRLEGDLAFQALLDPLTGLAATRLLHENLARALRRATRSGTDLAVLYLGLDGFRSVNERFGHEAADLILVVVAERLRDALPPGAVLARVGGDEFALCCENLGRPVQAFDLAGRLKQVLEAPILIEDGAISLSACIGVAVPTGEDDADAVVRQADGAMHLAKQRSRGSIQMVDAELDERLRRRQVTARELDAALLERQLFAVFQPQYDLRKGHLVGFEALARWAHPTDGIVGPADFVPIAEELGLIDRLGHQMLEAACMALTRFADIAPEQEVKVAVNVAPQQLLDPGFPDLVEGTLAATGMPARRLTVEITESALLDHLAAADALRRLKSIGVELAIDDFGTGYSSLDRLRYFPIDYVKIDRSFVDGMLDRTEDELIVGTILALGDGLGLEIVAEGVETGPQCAALSALGCHYAQGHLLGTPVELDRAIELVASGATLGQAPASGWRPVEVPRLEPLDEMTAGAAIALLSHELATPLSVLEGWAGLLATTTDPDEREPAIDAMCRAARQISTVLDLVRDTAAADGDRLPIDARATWLREPIAEAVAGCADRFSHAIEVDVADVAVPLDARRFTAALGNVLANVAKHVGREAVVRIVTVERDRVIELHVIDDGPGVPLDKLGVIFRRFGRANRRVAGTGLGLYVARAIARAHQGDLRYRRATPSGGADFVFELPLHAR